MCHVRLRRSHSVACHGSLSAQLTLGLAERSLTPKTQISHKSARPTPFWCATLCNQYPLFFLPVTLSSSSALTCSSRRQRHGDAGVSAPKPFSADVVGHLAMIRFYIRSDGRPDDRTKHAHAGQDLLGSCEP